jgi:hypothetical protein
MNPWGSKDESLILGEPRMNHHSTQLTLERTAKNSPASKEYVIGLDLGDAFSYLCLLDGASGEIEEQARLRTSPAGLSRYFAKLARARVALETGTHFPWVSRLLEGLGHEVLVANARHLRLVYHNDKNDRLDAENLAPLARLDPKLLHPITHCGEQASLARTPRMNPWLAKDCAAEQPWLLLEPNASISCGGR